MGESHIRIGASMARPPWPVLAALTLAILLAVAQLWPRIEAGVFSGPTEFWFVNSLVQLWFRALFLALLVHGLWRGSRFVHIVAILWLLETAALGLYTMFRNDYDWSYVVNLTAGGFYFGALPILVGLVGTVLLSLPPSWAWTSLHNRLRRH